MDDAPPPMGHNNPPPSDPEVAVAAYSAEIEESDAWLDGTPVETEGQMKAVDVLIAAVKDAEKAANAAKEGEYRPHKTAADAVIERWKPLLADLALRKKGLIAAVDGFKRRLAAEREAERRKAEAEARAAREAAEAAAHEASASDLEAQREAERLAEEARTATQAARRVEAVKGLRASWGYDITDAKALVNHIAREDRAAMMAFADDWARKAVRSGARDIPGVTIRRERGAV